jgi:hypothetical protein
VHNCFVAPLTPSSRGKDGRCSTGASDFSRSGRPVPESENQIAAASQQGLWQLSGRPNRRACVPPAARRPGMRSCHAPSDSANGCSFLAVGSCLLHNNLIKLLMNPALCWLVWSKPGVKEMPLGVAWLVLNTSISLVLMTIR